jgi:hypothetical protein
MVHTLANSKCHMVGPARLPDAEFLLNHFQIIFCTLRKEEYVRITSERGCSHNIVRGALKRAESIFSSKSRTKWIELEDGLSLAAISHMIARTLHRPREECAPLSRLVHNLAHGNAFSCRSFLMTLYRQNLV